jgi:hypothetical protein
VIVFAFASLILGAAPAAADDATPAAANPLAGKWTLASPDTSQKRVNAAIDKAVEDMNFVTRPIARGRLQDTNKVIKRLSIETKGSDYTIAFGPRSYTATLDAPPKTVKGMTGDPLKLTLTRTGDVLVQRFVGEDGDGRENQFTVGKDGRLSMKVRVFSGSLPKDIVYTLTFERAP